jgi:hypothetical protein
VQKGPERPRSSLGAKQANLILKRSRNDPKTSQIQPEALLEVPRGAQRGPEAPWELRANLVLKSSRNEPKICQI